MKRLLLYLLILTSISAEAQMVRQGTTRRQRGEFNELAAMVLFDASTVTSSTLSTTFINSVFPAQTGLTNYSLTTNGTNIIWAPRFSGSYTDLTDKPSLFSGVYTDLSGKPTLFSGAYADLTGKPSLFSGSYIDLTNKPSLFSGSYTDLTNKPTIITYTAGTNISIAGGVISDTYVFTPTINTGTARTIGTSFQVSTTRPSSVKYTIQLAAVVTLNAACYLEISANNSTWVEVSRFASSLGLLATQVSQLQADVPANYWVRLRKVETIGTVSLLDVQETIY